MHITSESLFERSKRVVPGGVHSPVRAFKGVGGVPRFMESANGAYLFDVEGKRYLDFCMSWGPMLFGHRDPEIEETVHQALARGWSFGTTEPYSLELAEWITSRIPWVEKIRFVNSGTEAVMSALRLARAATGRQKVLKFDGCYHGHVDSLLVRAGSGLAEMAEPDSAGISAEIAQSTLVCPLDNDQRLEDIFREHGSELAAVIIEPLPANNGLLIQRESFLKHIREQCSKHGALLIFDEVISGFRVALGGMAEVTGIRPDLVTYGKVIGGGFPVGAYAGRGDLMDFIAPSGPVYQAGTLSANPVSMCAGLAMMQKIERTNPYKTFATLEAHLKSGWEKIQQRTGTDLRCIQSGSLFWFVTQTAQPRQIDAIPADQKSRFSVLFHALLNDSVYLAPSGFEVGFLSTAHTTEHLDELLDKIGAQLARDR